MDAEVKKDVQGKVIMGVEGLMHPTPSLVLWIFRTEFVLNKAAMIWISSTDLLKGINVKEVMLTLAIIDFVVWGLGRFIGIKKEDFDTT